MTPTRHARSRHRFRFSALLALVALAAAAVPAATPTAAWAAGPPATQTPSSYILVDADRGTVLLAHNEHDAHYTASTIKVLTALVTLEHLPLSAPLHVSRLAAAQPASKIDMKEGSTWPLDQALHALMIISANDAAYAMAENAGGDLAHFAQMANATAKRLGLQNTSFHDPAGLDGRAGFEGGTTASSYDLAIVARNALTVPAIAGPAGLVTYEFTDPTGAGRRLLNHNRGFLTSYPGAIGLKTGFTDQASRTLITAARRNGRTLIAVVMGTWDDTGWAGYLLDQGFAGATPTGVKLPPVRVAPLDGRADAFAGLPSALGSGPPAGATPTAAVLGTTATRHRAGSTGSQTGGSDASAPREKSSKTTSGGPAATRSTPASTGAPAATPAAGVAIASTVRTADDGWTFGSTLKVLGIIGLGLLVAVVGLRRRAVKRQRARRIKRLRAHREARRRGMIDIIEPDDADVRVMPARTSHHVAATGKRHPADRRVLRPARPRSHGTSSQDRMR